MKIIKVPKSKEEHLLDDSKYDCEGSGDDHYEGSGGEICLGEMIDFKVMWGFCFLTDMRTLVMMIEKRLKSRDALFKERNINLGF